MSAAGYAGFGTGGPLDNTRARYLSVARPRSSMRTVGRAASADRGKVQDRCSGRVKAAAPGAAVRAAAAPGAATAAAAAGRARAGAARSRPISRSCCAAARTASGACCRAASAPAPASRSSSSRSSCSGWRAASTACCPTRSASCCASAPTTARPSRASTTTCRRRSRAVLTPSVTRVNRTEIGYPQRRGPDPRAGARQVPEEALMLTGDENIVDINFTVFWVDQGRAGLPVQHPRPEATVKSAAESAMREVVGETPIAQALAEGRGKIETDTQHLLQAHPRLLRRRDRDHPGAAAEGRSAGPGDRRVPRRAARPRRSRAAAQRGRILSQRHHAAGARRRGADQAGGRSLSRARSSPARRATPTASPSVYNAYQGGAGRHRCSGSTSRRWKRS